KAPCFGTTLRNAKTEARHLRVKVIDLTADCLGGGNETVSEGNTQVKRPAIGLRTFEVRRHALGRITMRHLAQERERNPSRINAFVVAADCKLYQRIAPLRLS